MSRSSSSTISAQLGLKLVVPQQTIVPLVASMYYSGSDPYAVRMAFHVGTDEPVEWIFARDLLAAGIESRQGDGDVQVWPSPASVAETGDLDLIGTAEPGESPGKVLNSSCRRHSARLTLRLRPMPCRRSCSGLIKSSRLAGKAATSTSRRS